MDGLREVREELGRDFKPDQLIYLGRKLHVSPDTKDRLRQNVVEVFMVEDNSELRSYKLQEKEVYAICACHIDELIKVHTQDNYTFNVKGINYAGDEIEIEVTKESFPYNWDNYHFKIALLANRFIKGEENLVY
jgi:hypothetical protein